MACLLIYTFYKFSGNEQRSNKKTISFILVRLYSICINQCKCIFDFFLRYLQFFPTASNVPSEKIISVRMILSSILFASFVLNQFFSTEFFSLITVKQYETPVDTLDDIARFCANDANEVWSVKVMAFNKVLQTTAQSQNALFHSIGVKLNRSTEQGKSIPHETLLMKTIEENPTVGAVDSKLIFDIYQRFYVQKRSGFRFHTASEHLAQFYHCVAVQKGSPLLRPFDMT